MFSASFYTASVNADVNLVVPFYTKHIQYDNYKTYTEDLDNHALGLEYSNGYVDVGSTYVHKNSHNKQSLYNHLLGFYTAPNGIRIGGGLFIAIGGYDLPMLAAPIWSASYKWVRMTTSYPAVKLANGDFDLLNVQLIIPLR